MSALDKKAPILRSLKDKERGRKFSSHTKPTRLTAQISVYSKYRSQEHLAVILCNATVVL